MVEPTDFAVEVLRPTGFIPSSVGSLASSARKSAKSWVERVRPCGSSNETPGPRWN